MSSKKTKGVNLFLQCVGCVQASPALQPSLRLRSDPEARVVVDMARRPVLDCFAPMESRDLIGMERERLVEDLRMAKALI